MISASAVVSLSELSTTTVPMSTEVTRVTTSRADTTSMIPGPSTKAMRDVTTVRRTTRSLMTSTSVRTPPTPTTSLPIRLRANTTSMILPVSATTTMVTATPVRRTTVLSMTDSTRRMLSSSTPTVVTDSSPTPTMASTLPDSANADNHGVGRNIGAGRGTFGQGYGFSNYSHTHDDSNAGFLATKFGGRNDAKGGRGDHAKRSYHRRSYW